MCDEQAVEAGAERPCHGLVETSSKLEDVLPPGAPHRASWTRSVLNGKTGSTRVMAETSVEGPILKDIGPLGKPKDPMLIQHKTPLPTLFTTE